MEIKVLGAGCKKCNLLEENIKKALKELGIEATVEKITDPDLIAEFGVLQTPGLVVDGKVKLAGRVATAKKIKTLLN